MLGSPPALILSELRYIADWITVLFKDYHRRRLLTAVENTRGYARKHFAAADRFRSGFVGYT